MINKYYLLLIIIALIPFVVAVDLDCGLYNTTCPNSTTELLALSNTTNSHAQLVNYTTTHYTNLLCCNSSTYSVGNISTGNYSTFLRLINTTNSHSQTTGSYHYQAYISSNTTVNCTTATTTCAANFTCLISISGTSNAHVANCSHYTTQVCCALGNVTVVPPVTPPVNVTPPSGGGGYTPLPPTNITGNVTGILGVVPPKLVGYGYMFAIGIFGFIFFLIIDRTMQKRRWFILGDNDDEEKKRKSKWKRFVAMLSRNIISLIIIAVITYLVMKPKNLLGYLYVLGISFILFIIIIFINNQIKKETREKRG